MFLPPATNPFGGGAAGVDIFFVISGFIMWYISQNREPKPLDFLIHRIIRVAPPYWLATLTLALFATLKPNLFPLDDPTIDHVVMSLAFVPYGMDVYGRPIISQGWTLNYEMFFYIVFAAMLLLPSTHRFKALAALFLTLAVVGLFTATRIPALYLLTSDLLLEFLVGIAIAIAFQKGRLAPIWLAVCGIVLGTLILAVNISVDLPRAFVRGIPAAVIVYCMVSIERHGLFGKNQFLLMLGEISFALYIIHFLAASVYLISAPHLGLPIKGLVAYLWALGGAIIASFAFYKFAENPMRKFLQSRLKQMRAKREVKIA